MGLARLAVSVAAASALLVAAADAQNYPWCAVYGAADFGGASNCGFATFEQCMATLSGIGGFCERNNLYVPPPGPHPPASHQGGRHRSYAPR